jgi:hypothetical protein
LEEQLRQLPKPKLPDGLEAKLLAAIPAIICPKTTCGAGVPPAHAAETAAPQTQSLTTVPKAAPPKIRRWLAGAAIAVAAAGILFCLVSQSRNPNVSRQPNSSNENPTAPSAPHSLAVINMKETDPCNILPPLPDWH